MFFNPVIACGPSSLSGESMVLIALWFLPTVLLALRNCLPDESSRQGAMKLLLLTSVALSALMTAIWWDVVAEAIIMALLLGGLMVAASALSIWLYRLSLKV